MHKELRDRSIHELRGMAQAFGITDIFEKDVLKLVQEIELKQQKLVDPPKPLPPRPEYDARLMTAQPSAMGSPIEITDLLEPHIRIGLKLRFDEECWHMSNGNKFDTGSLRMPLRQILDCAEKVLR